MIGIYYAVAHRWKTAAKQPKKCTANLRLAFYCRPFVPFHPPHHNSTEVYGSCQGGGTVSYRFVGETCLGKLTLMTTSWPTLCSPFHTAITGGLHHFQTWHRSNALAIFLSTSESAATWRTRGFWDQGSLVFVRVRVILQGVFQEFNELFQDCTWMFGRDSPASGPPHKRKCNTVSTMNHEFKIHYVYFTSHDIHYTILQSTRYTSNPAEPCCLKRHVPSETPGANTPSATPRQAGCRPLVKPCSNPQSQQLLIAPAGLADLSSGWMFILASISNISIKKA